jgi:hypothetical protein
MPGQVRQQSTHLHPTQPPQEPLPYREKQKAYFAPQTRFLWCYLRTLTVRMSHFGGSDTLAEARGWVL